MFCGDISSILTFPSSGQKMNVIEDFISNQKKILRLEREFCQRKRGPGVAGDLRGSHLGKILKTFVPKYGGTVVTFDISGYRDQEDFIKRTLKLGDIIETR